MMPHPRVLLCDGCMASHMEVCSVCVVVTSSLAEGKQHSDTFNNSNYSNNQEYLTLHVSQVSITSLFSLSYICYPSYITL